MSTFGKIGARDLVWRPPYDAEVEYLESTGTQWIDTGIVPDASTVCAAEIMYTDTRTQQFGSGCVSGGLWAILFGYYQGHAHFWPGVYQPNINLNRNVNERFSCGFDIPLQKYAVDGVWTYNSVITPPTGVVQSFALFARKNSETNYSSPCSMRLYSFSISVSAKLISLIPVRVGSGSSAVGYLYDRANPDGGPLGNGLYPNAGTGAFILGPDKS